MKLFAIVMFVSLIPIPTAFAQKAGDATTGLPVHAPNGAGAAPRDSVVTFDGYNVTQERGRPRWLKAAALGALGGAAIALAGHALSAGSDADQRSLSTDFMIGVVGGAAIAGTTIAFFD